MPYHTEVLFSSGVILPKKEGFPVREFGKPFIVNTLLVDR